MYVIETELGRFEGETEKDAKKLLKAAEKAKKEQALIDMQHSQMASLKAKAGACHIMQDFLRERPMCDRWIIEPGQDFFDRYVRHEDWKVIIRADDFTGAPEWHYSDSYKVRALDIACDGSVRAIWLQYAGEETYGSAVGYHENTVGLEHLPDQITLEWAKGEVREPVNAPVSILA